MHADQNLSGCLNNSCSIALKRLGWTREHSAFSNDKVFHCLKRCLTNQTATAVAEIRKRTQLFTKPCIENYGFSSMYQYQPGAWHEKWNLFALTPNIPDYRQIRIIR